MSLLVVGSMALDTIETPFGEARDILGGSASYFSVAASVFTQVKIVAVVGEDFPKEHLQIFRARGIDLSGVTTAPGQTFRWHGRYGSDLADPKTLATHLNVFEKFSPSLPEDYRDADFVFLANIDPKLQLNVLKQAKSPKLVACDTMNFWIQNKPDDLKEVLRHVDVLIINDSETRYLANEPKIIKAAKRLLQMGPSTLIVKRGEYGALMFSEEGMFWSPSYPLEEVIDPTGAGDTFAGSFMGYLASLGRKPGIGDFKRAVVYGGVAASFTVEDFSLGRLAKMTRAELEARFDRVVRLSNLD
ncbi:MAG: PfkB family carbohydrate kinase [Deltaproteobacteria bacterium]